MESSFDRVIIISFALQLLLAVLGANNIPTNNHDENEFVKCLTQDFESSSSLIFTPNNASYSSLLHSYNSRPASTSPLKPLLIISPFYEFEIQSAIHCSKKLATHIRVRSGGHDYEGLSYTSPIPFVLLDMRNLRSITINTADKTAWVQSGATLGELYRALARESKTLAFPGGTYPSVGVGGHLSGGGYGMISRKHAIASDQIVDAVLIDANGKVLDRGSMGEDHFWAIRGGGGTSFGIIVAFKVNLVDVPETVTVFNVTRTNNVTNLVDRWQYVANKIDENLVMRLFLRSLSVSSSRRTVVVSFTSLFLGRARDLLPLMEKEFPELGLVGKDCVEMSWIESVLFFAGLHGKPVDALLPLSSVPPQKRNFYAKGKSDYVRQPIPVHGLREMWRFMNELEDEGRVEVQFTPYGGMMDTISESESPFPHRGGNVYLILYSVFWYGDRIDDAGERHIEWIRRVYGYMARYVSKSPRAAYFNYRDLDIGMNNMMINATATTTTLYEQASVWGFKYFNNNFDRLVRVKTRVDPSNFFRNEQSIPPLSSSTEAAAS